MPQKKKRKGASPFTPRERGGGPKLLGRERKIFILRKNEGGEGNLPF